MERRSESDKARSDGALGQAEPSEATSELLSAAHGGAALDQTAQPSTPSLPGMSPPRRKVARQRVLEPTVGSSPLRADASRRLRATPFDHKLGHNAALQEPNAAQSSTASNSTRPADKGGRGKLSSLDQRTPTHRRLLLPSRDGDGKKAKELVEVDGARAAKEQEQEQDEQERARAKRRRTIKQDESLGDSANAAMPEDQRASSEGPELDLMGAQQDTGAGGAHEDLGGSQGAGSSEGEPDTQE